jgi:hypothetical protein
MKKLMVLGALVGFSSGLAIGFLQKSPWSEVFWRASILCFLSSFLFRWWGRVWLCSLRQAHDERLRAQELQHTPPAKV